MPLIILRKTPSLRAPLSLLSTARRVSTPGPRPLRHDTTPKGAAAKRSFATSSALCSNTRQSVPDGRTAIVTGSSRGIGKAIALRLASDGYSVCVHDVPANKAGCEEVVDEIRRMDGGGGEKRKACYALADVSRRAEVDALIKTSVEQLGPLDVMVANAGIAQVKPVLDITEADLERMFRVNVLGLHNTYAAAARQMIAQKSCRPDRPGKIIGAASIAAFKPTPLLSHYTASKFAVRGLTQGFAVELAPHNITVNAYAPGIVGTAMWDLIDAEMARQHGVAKGEVLKKMVHDNTALGRVSVVEDVARLVSFLASSDSDFVTGQTQVVDGGIVYT
ncbi:acetoin reductase [Microdochium trichocladiopsis]|uniref:Acetoin reductase n=1 Tax=Microdochium trichocladiopsis TaxID=1682393 RepID=A0A9P8YK05_9PEZI|nr:acetoin reductase [Microdochium trichocladiopsis]KAH7040846.1 acetoin reductase [Microdochium trichocladiopsis]